MLVPPKYYHDFYLLFVTFFSVIAFIRYSWVPKEKKGIEGHNFSFAPLELFVVLFLILFIGLRNPYSRLFGDTVAYTWFFERVNFYHGFEFVWNWDAKNIIFDNLYAYMAYNFDSVSSFYIVIASVSYIGIWVACRKIFPNDALAALMVCLGAFTAFGGAINGIKASAASSLFLVALAINDSNNIPKVLSYIFLFLSVCFHHSMLVPVFAFVFCKFVRLPQIFVIIWLSCLLLAVFHVTFFQELFSSIGEELGNDKVVDYLGAESNIDANPEAERLRIDFILYSAAPIVLGWVALFAKGIKSEKYEFLLNVYTFVNAIWLLCMYASFTNRIASLSWLMYPILLIYPLLKENWGDNKFSVFKVVAYAHLGFTLFMKYFY